MSSPGLALTCTLANATADCAKKDALSASNGSTLSHSRSQGVRSYEDKNGGSALTLETLSCESYYYPGTKTVPFIYPPPTEDLVSCRRDNRPVDECPKNVRVICSTILPVASLPLPS